MQQNPTFHPCCSRLPGQREPRLIRAQAKARLPAAADPLRRPSQPRGLCHQAPQPAGRPCGHKELPPLGAGGEWLLHVLVNTSAKGGGVEAKAKGLSGLVLSSVPLGSCEEHLCGPPGAETCSGAVASKVGPLAGSLGCG